MANRCRLVAHTGFGIRGLDTPDLGLRNHRFQSVAFHFKINAFYEWKTGFSFEIVAVANGE
jgi:hypothetical protein